MLRPLSGFTPYPPIASTSSSGGSGVKYSAPFIYIDDSLGLPNPITYDLGTGKAYYGDREIKYAWITYGAGYKIGGIYYNSYSYGNKINIAPFLSTSPLISDSIKNQLGTSLIDTTGWDGFQATAGAGLMFADSPDPAWPSYLGPVYISLGTYTYNYP